MLRSLSDIAGQQSNHGKEAQRMQTIVIAIAFFCNWKCSFMGCRHVRWSDDTNAKISFQLLLLETSNWVFHC